MKKSAKKKTARRKSGAPAHQSPATPARTKAAPKTPAAAPRRKPAARPPAVPIPSLLLEGDQSASPVACGPGERYALGSGSAAASTPPTPAELPEAYGTQRLQLTARDPRWLYAHWDMTGDQLRRHNGKSIDRHLVLRVYRNEIQGAPHREIPVHPESRSWFVHVGAGDTRYTAELGYYGTKRQWTRVAVSGVTMTPPDNLSDDTSVWFAEWAGRPASGQLLTLLQAALARHLPLREALQQLRAQGHEDLPEPGETSGPAWTPVQEAALAQVVTVDQLRRVWIGSLEITELLRRQLVEGWSSPGAGPPSSWSEAAFSVASPLGGLPPGRPGFWFNVNAELILYGATEKDATVTIGGRPIRLRPDGTFSYRFSLPDGCYHLPAVAVSADGTDARQAALTFSRSTDYRGEVGAHPQDPNLRPPLPTHVS